MSGCCFEKGSWTKPDPGANVLFVACVYTRGRCLRLDGATCEWEAQAAKIETQTTDRPNGQSRKIMLFIWFQEKVSRVRSAWSVDSSGCSEHRIQSFRLKWCFTVCKTLREQVLREVLLCSDTLLYVSGIQHKQVFATSFTNSQINCKAHKDVVCIFVITGLLH